MSKYFMFLCLVLLISCSKNQSSNQIWRIIKYGFNGQNQDNISRDYASKLPYASLSAKLGDDANVMMVLGYVDGDKYYWYSHNKQIIILRDNKIIRSVNFANNLEYFLAKHNIFNQNLYNLQYPISQEYIYDFDPRTLVNIKVMARLIAIGYEEIEIYGYHYQTRKIKEIITIPYLKQQFENIYWVAKDGYIWKSIQYFHPLSKPLTIQILKRAS